MNDKSPATGGGDKFQLRLREVNISEDKLLEDLRRVASQVDNDKVSYRIYSQFGNYAWTTLARRFGSWNKALDRAGCSIINEVNISDLRLFENLESVWVGIGRQPGRRDMVPPHSAFSYRPYTRRFGTWNKALRAFIDYINEAEPQGDAIFMPEQASASNRTGREVGLRLRFRIMQRDHFKCRICGTSPATDQQVILHVDHIVPWSKGGATEIDNLQTLCSNCNVGKGALNQ